MSQTVAQILRKAAEALRKKGHTKGTRLNHAGQMCAIGAIEHVTNGNYIDDSDAAVKALGEHVPQSPIERHTRNPISWAIADWNNAPERTAEEVIATFEAAACCEEHKETAF